MTDLWNGEERRMTQDEQLGYLAGKLESTQAELSEFKQRFYEHAEREEKDREIILKEIQGLKNMWSIRAAVIKTLKMMGLAFLFLVTFNFGDLINLIKRLF